MNTAGCTTGWMNYANEPSQAALERASQDVYDVIELIQQSGCMDSRRCGVWSKFLRRIFLLIYSFFTIGCIWSWGWQKLDSIKTLHETVLYLFMYYMNIPNVSSSRLHKRLPTTGCKVYIGLRTLKTTFMCTTNLQLKSNILLKERKREFLTKFRNATTWEYFNWRVHGLWTSWWIQCTPLRLGISARFRLYAR